MYIALFVIIDPMVQVFIEVRMTYLSHHNHLPAMWRLSFDSSCARDVYVIYICIYVISCALSLLSLSFSPFVSMCVCVSVH